MKIIKISDVLYRVNNKDCWIKNGEIQIPENPCNILKPTERQAVEMEIF